MRTCIVLILCFLATNVFAQGPVTTPRDSLIRSVNDIGFSLLGNYHPQQDSVRSRCLDACVFIKFKISKKGKFENLAYTKGTPIFITTALTKAFANIESKLAIANLDKISTETFILPMQYVFNIGCLFESFVKPGTEPTNQEIKIYNEKRYDKKQSTISISNINNFTDGQFESLRCIILAPIDTGGEMF